VRARLKTTVPAAQARLRALFARLLVEAGALPKTARQG